MKDENFAKERKKLKNDAKARSNLILNTYFHWYENYVKIILALD